MQQLIDQTLFQRLVDEARHSPRKRAHHNLHRHFDEPVQRVCIGLVQGTYVRPHAHLELHQWELILGLRGRTCLVIFDPDGRISARHVFSETASAGGIQLPPGTWHTLYPADPESIILEIKQGPYDPRNAARFASWAPEEQSDQAARFLGWLAQAPLGGAFP
jgi:cupin fold WbuC family metalloprotein